MQTEEVDRLQILLSHFPTRAAMFMSVFVSVENNIGFSR